MKYVCVQNLLCLTFIHFPCIKKISRETIKRYKKKLNSKIDRKLNRRVHY